MQNNISNGSRAVFPWGFAALWVALAMGLGLMPAEAAPFAYVANFSAPGTVSVIDTATTPPAVVATIPVGGGAGAVAVTPDGKHAYVTGSVVSVIDTATNKVVATVPVSGSGVAVTPDGKRAYVANDNVPGTVSVIDTATNKVAAAVPVAVLPFRVAVTPDGKRAYVAHACLGVGCVNSFEAVSVIDIASNMEVARLSLGLGVFAPSVGGVAIAPDGKHAYVAAAEAFSRFSPPDSFVFVIDTATNTVGRGPVLAVPSFLAGDVAVTPNGKQVYVTNDNGTVSVIATATNTVVATVPGVGGGGIAITPDGKHAYVANGGGTVPVIATASNTVVATVPVPAGAGAVGIVPPPPGIPFLAFNAQLAIHFGGAPNQDSFKLQSSFTLGSASNGIKPLTEAVKLQVGTFTTTIPPGSFKELAGGPFLFQGVIDGVALDVLITPTGTKRFALTADAKGANLTGTKNEVQVSLIIGDDSGTTSVKAQISGTAPVTAQISH